MLDLHLLHQFVAVAEEGHVGRAAARLHVSGSPLSRRMQQLEDSLGLALFSRERRRLALTPTGRWFLDQSRALLAHADRLEQQVVARRQGTAAPVVMGVVVMILISKRRATARRTSLQRKERRKLHKQL